MQSVHINLVAALAAELAEVEALRDKIGQRTYGRDKEEYFLLNYHREDMATIGCRIPRDVAIQITTDRVGAIKGAMRKWGVRFPEDPEAGSITPILAGEHAEARN